ncbi:hypothetical protein [Cytophaga aurantiaca]|uniref:hypothetical protein n=1 Tax=Cytophaga aurantiaca TaxID=29530 RepID=UPI00037762FC|nr:hypothetical protein [Cytophaga aurantiaca]
MGTVTGLIAKHNNKICFLKGIYITDTDSLLSEHFKNIKSYSEYFQTNYEGNVDRKNWLRFSDKEINALNVNYVSDFAVDQINNSNTLNESLPDNFYAIGLNYDWEYDEKFIKYESWSTYREFSEALDKIAVMSSLNIHTKSNISEYDLILHELIMKFIGIKQSIYTIYNPSEIAIISGPY